MSYSSAMPEDCDEPRKKSGGGAASLYEFPYQKTIVGSWGACCEWYRL